MSVRKQIVSRLPYLAVLAGLLGMAPVAWAQEWLVLDPLVWELGLKYDGSWRTASTGDSTDIEYKESIRLRQTGHSVDPKIASFLLDLNPVWTQGEFDLPDRDDAFNGDDLNYNANLSLLHGTPGPVSFDAQATQSSGSTDFDLGSRSEYEYDNWRVGLNLKNRFFPATLSYSERYSDRISGSGFSTVISQREELVEILSFKGRSSKMNVDLEQLDFDDRIFDNDYEQDTARLNHTARWGKASRLNSTVDYLDREGFGGQERLLVTEDLNLQHLRNLSSFYRYQYSSDERELETRRDYFKFGLEHQLYRNLTTRVALSKEDTDFEVGEELEKEVRLDLNYNKKIAGDGRLTAGIGAARRNNDRNAQPGAFLEGEDRFEVFTTTTSVILSERFIDTTTIKVTNLRTNQPYFTPQDYTVNPLIDGFTEIVITPDPGQIALDAQAASPLPITIRVEYDYPVPELEYDTDILDFRTTVDFGWVSLFYRYYDSDQDLVSGAAENFLTDTRDSAVGLKFRWVRPGTTATFDVETRSRESGDFESDEVVLRQSVIHTLTQRASLNVSAIESRTEGEATEADLVRADVFLKWRPRPTLSVTPRLGMWNREQKEPKIEDRYFTARVDLGWVVRKLRLTTSLQRNEWSGTATDTDENRLMFTVTRRSR